MSERLYVFLGLFFFVIAVLIALHDIVSANLSTKGDELKKLRNQVNYYTEQNLILKEKVLHEESLSIIEEKAKRQGFIPIGKTTLIH